MGGQKRGGERNKGLEHKKRDLTDVYGPWEDHEPEYGVNFPRA